IPTADILRLAEILDKAGFAYLEISGGGTFDSAVRRGVESPWERIRALKARTKTPLALAVRGRFLVGTRPVGGDFARRFVASAAQSGIDVFRLHDPLNDVDNLREAAAGDGRGTDPPQRPCRAAAAAPRGQARHGAARADRAAGRSLRAGRGRQRAGRSNRGDARGRGRDRLRRLPGRAHDAPRLV